MTSRAKLLEGVPLDQRPAQMSSWPEYAIWSGMLSRCRDGKNKRYGGRGIKVCDRWATSFRDFIEDMGPRPSTEHSIDRIDNDGNYEPGNCRWATRREQSNNTSQTKLLTLRGVTRPHSEWARSAVVCAAAFTSRIIGGIPLVIALSLLEQCQSRHDTDRFHRRLFASRRDQKHVVSLAGTDGLVFAEGGTLAEAIGNLVLTEPQGTGIEVRHADAARGAA